jgi:hemerythrin-like domain-containing protein
LEATRILMEEHRLIERVLTALETASQRLAQAEEMRPAFYVNAALFIKNFADGCHHSKEEGVLFKTLHELGMPIEGGPLGVMFSEHEQGRLFTAEMRDAAQKWEAGDATARGAVIHNASGYVALLRQHIQKEDGILFPLADRIIPVAKQDMLTTEFERIKREETGLGIHEKYLALAEVLESESTRRITS